MHSRVHAPAGTKSPAPHACHDSEPQSSPYPMRSAAFALVVGALSCVACSQHHLAPPTVTGDRVLVEQQDAVLVVDTESGSVLERLHSSGVNQTAPAICDRILYQVQPDGRITGIHIDNPQKPFAIWQHDEARAPLRLLGVDAHRVYVADSDELYAIDRVFGQRVWSYAMSTQHVDELAISGDTIVLSADERVRAIDARLGREMWSHDAESSVGPAAIMDDTAYVATADGKVLGLSLSDGTECWRYDGTTDACSHDRPWSFARDGVVYACFDDAVRAISIETRKVGWTFGSFPVALGEGVLIAQGDDDTLIGIDTARGQQIWTRTLDEDMVVRPVVDGQVAYVRDDTGKLHAVSVKTGAVLWVQAGAGG